MSTAKATLYDLLGLAANAGPHHIRDAFDNLSDQHAAGKLPAALGLDADTRFSLIKDAFFTLSDPDRRAAYDASLLPKIPSSLADGDYAVHEDGASRAIGGKIKLLALLIVLGGVGMVWKSYNDQQKILAQIQLEQAQAERAVAERQAEMQRQEEERQRQYAARRLQSQQEAEKRQHDYEAKRTWAEAEANARNLERLEAQREREAQYKQSRNLRDTSRSAETAAAREKAAADQRARQDAAKVRQLEYEYERRRQAGIIQR